MKLFLRGLKSKREATGYFGPAILILESCTVHDGDYFEGPCLCKNVVAVSTPAIPQITCNRAIVICLISPNDWLGN
jgi:hypothetical protein